MKLLKITLLALAIPAFAFAGDGSCDAGSCESKKKKDCDKTEQKSVLVETGSGCCPAKKDKEKEGDKGTAE